VAILVVVAEEADHLNAVTCFNTVPHAIMRCQTIYILCFCLMPFVINVFSFIFSSRLVSLYNLAYQRYRRDAQKTRSVISWPHLWVLCDAKDKNHTAYLSASFCSVKPSCMQSSFVANKYSNGSLQSNKTKDAGDDQSIAAGNVITTRGSVCFLLFLLFYFIFWS